MQKYCELGIAHCGLRIESQAIGASFGDPAYIADPALHSKFAIRSPKLPNPFHPTSKIIPTRPDPAKPPGRVDRPQASDVGKPAVNV